MAVEGQHRFRRLIDLRLHSGKLGEVGAEAVRQGVGEFLRGVAAEGLWEGHIEEKSELHARERRSELGCRIVVLRHARAHRESIRQRHLGCLRWRNLERGGEFHD